MEEFMPFFWRGLVLASTIYGVLLGVAVIGRLLHQDKHEPERVMHVISLALSWFIGRAYVVVDTIDRWYLPLFGVRVSLALMSNLWAIIGLHIMWRWLGQQKTK